MKTYTLHLAGLERQLPLVDISENMAYASFVCISDTELVKAAAPLLAEKIKDCDIVLTAEAKGIALAYEVSKCLGHPCFAVARKSVKSYMKDPISVDVRSITTFDDQKLYLDSADAEKIKDRRVCLLDDVVSTGGSLKALKELCEKAGGIVSCSAALLAEGKAAKRKDLIYLEELPLFHKDEEGNCERISDDIFEYLRHNEYPGRGILTGYVKDEPVIAYFIMGRSTNSRNRVFRKENNVLYTKAFDESKVADPSLIIYNAMREYNGSLIVTNGDQTDTVHDFLKEGKSFKEALETRVYEPDAPNYTPRICALVKQSSYEMAILKKNEEECERIFYHYEKENGKGHFISTYDHNGDPLPSFSQDPIEVDIEDDFFHFSNKLWNALNSENKISLYVRMGDEERIFNKNEGD